MGSDIGYKVTRRGRTIPVVMLADPVTGQPVGGSGASNVVTKFRDAFETYTPIAFTDTGTSQNNWRELKASEDIVVDDGNAIACSYLDISKDPLVQGTETVIEALSEHMMPFEMSVGAHMSQRVLGQEFAIEMVDIAPPLPEVADIAVSSLNQAAAVLTIVTTSPHGLTPGKSFGLRGFADSRANYSALVVASIPNATTVTATAGPGGTIPALTLTALTGGFIYFRERLGRANEGSSIIFENTSTTNASFYIRSEKGDALPSGTAIGNHSVTTGSTASVQAITAARTYAFQPTTEFRLRVLADRIQWTDVGVDSQGGESNRVTRTQVVPDPDVAYKLRIRATNNKSLTVPVGTIISATKAGSTTATILFSAPHGLTVNDQIVIYGIRDQTNFANLTTSTNPASIVDATSITIAFGGTFTGVSYGGYASRVQGGNGQGGAIAQSITNATLAGGTLTLVGTAAWSGLVIGDYVNVHGCRINLTGADRGIDGAWKVDDIQTASLVLVKPKGLTAPADFAAGDCGGAVIKRTCLRLSFVRVFDFERNRVEATPRPFGDISTALPVVASLASGANLIGDVNIQYRASSTGGASIVLVTSPAVPAGQPVKASPGRLLGYDLRNGATTVRYIKFYNATTVTMGTTSAIFEIALDPGQSKVLQIPGGINFGTGIQIAITSDRGQLANSGATLGAGDITGYVFFV
jgi:hypothetical protein